MVVHYSEEEEGDGLGVGWWESVIYGGPDSSDTLALVRLTGQAHSPTQDPYLPSVHPRTRRRVTLCYPRR